MMKRLYRTRSDRYIAGVCGGLARYFDLDPTLFRLAMSIVLVLSFFTAGIIYLIAWMIIPENPDIPFSE